jgi:levanase/fructan beta-fructosidase
MDASNTWYEDLEFHRQEVATYKKIVDFEIYIDRGSIELFADGGKVAITNLLFVETALSTVSSTGEVLNLEVINLS